MKNKKFTFWFIVILIFLINVSIISAATIFVDASATGANNGTSWSNAYTSFQTALDNSISGCDIWVAKGTYRPSTDNGLGGGSRYYHFKIIYTVDVYGGFAGTETSIDERENYGQGEANETIFSGDLNGDDVGFTNNTENCYHVIYNTTSINATYLDGVTISGGNANGTGDHAKGGGMFNTSTSRPLLNHVIFSGNSAEYGGGIYGYNSSLMHTNVTYNNNIADYGGGICIQGAITETKLHNCIISGNKANFDGGGVFIQGARFLPINTTITGNHADGNGGGLHANNSNGPQSDIKNSILWGNTANNSGAQIYIINTSYSHPYIYNCDVEGGAAGIGLSSGTYSGIYQNNIDGDPNFVTDVPSPVPSAGGDFHLINDYPTSTSPCFEAGNNAYLGFGPTTDFDGENRIQVEHVDIGAYEGGNYSTSPIIYVDINATGNNDGITWANAFTDLQWALLIARTCPGFTTINVAAGTYKPTSGTDQTISFAMVNGISILGGYPTGGGTRDWETNETILSGDLSGNDVFDVTNHGFQGTSGDDNSYHVIYNDSLINLNTTAVLDGFTISGGYAPIEDTQTPIDFTPSSGGGMCNLSASPKVINCTFTANQALIYGGGMYNYNGSSPDVCNCTFYQNITYRNALCGGAGIANRSESSPTVDSCDFISNYSCVGAAGMYNETACDAVVTNCLFSENILFMDPIQQWTNYGAGMINYSNQPVIIDCIFSGNVAGYWGRGGAMFNAQSVVTLTNVVFINNTAQHFGGAIFMDYEWESVYTNCTFFGNSTDWLGGAVYLRTSTGLYENSIFWGNTAGTAGNQICYNGGEGETDFYHCDMQGGTAAFGYYNEGTYTGTYTGNYLNNIDTDPLFVDALNDDLRLYGNSPAVNTGNNSYNAEPTDLRGQARIQNTTIDMGAYEWTAGLDPYMSTGNTIYVDVNASGGNDGSGWADAFTSLQSALDVAISCNEIWVAKGTYKPGDDHGLGGGSRYYHFRMIEGVEIYGGFAGTETAVSQRTNFGSGETNETILSGDLSSNDDFDASNGGYQGTSGDDNCYHVLYHPDGLNLTSSTVFDGFTITGGNANGAADPQNKAGALYLYSSSPTIQNVNFHSNMATGFGGAAYMYNSTSALSTVSFTENISGGGGAFYISYASPVLNNCIFTDNVSSGDGGAFSTHSSSPTLTNALFSSNTAGNNGGAIIFYSNSVQYNATLNNVTVSDNQASANGGGIRFASNNAASTLNLNNSIIWGNTATTSGNELSLISTGNTTLNYSCYKNETNDVVVSNGTLTATNNNTTFNPGFVDPVSDDFRIRGFSPCKDNGSNGYNALASDIREEDRIQNTTIDMGAYEWTEGTDPLNNAENVLYVSVDASGADNGSSWVDAFTSLQSALDVGTSGVEIWVAKGTYKPSYDYGLLGGPHIYHFRLIEGVEIYGGFAGSETAVSQRTNFGLGEANETILSGDLSGDDDFDINTGGYQGTTGMDNCAHVLYHPDGLNLTSTSILDGFTITGGNANGPDTHIKAGGLYLYSSSPTIQNVIFKSNQAIELGGAAYIYNSTSEFSDVSFVENISAGGGGLYVSTGSPVFTNAVFTGNVSSADGGALSSHSSTVTITNALFADNNCSQDGGALELYSSSTAFTTTLTNVTTANNTSGRYGGGINFQSSASSSLVLNNSIVYGNTATTNGNEIASNSSGGTTLNYSCYDNDTNDVVVSNGTLTATNNNTTFNPGFVDPASDDYRIRGFSPCKDNGSNGFNALSTDIRGEDRIQNSTIDMGAYEWTEGVDPQYNAENVLYVAFDASGADNGSSWTDAFVSLQSALNVATSGSKIWVAKGTYKPSYEYGLGEGDSDDLFNKNEGIEVNDKYGKTKNVKNNSTNNRSSRDSRDSRNYHFRLIEGVEIYGGFAGTETSVEQRTNYDIGEVNETILSGDLSSNDNFDVTNGGYQGTTGDDNCYHVLYHPNGLNLTSSAVLDGFTISGGNANGTLSAHTKAGGLYLTYSSPTIRNIVFTSNSSATSAGGVYLDHSTSLFTNISIIDNTTTSSVGGGIFISYGDPEFDQIEIVSNYAPYAGGMYIYSSTPVLNNIKFTSNSSADVGGGLYTHSASPTITNALFASNTAGTFGGAIIFYSSDSQYDATLNNVTISDNQAGQSGGAIRFASNNAASTLNINNSIIWGNTATTSGNELSLVDAGSTTLNYSCYRNLLNDIEGAPTVTNQNITSDPKFVLISNNPDHPYSIAGISPCCDTGNDDYNSEIFDIRGTGFSRKLDKNTGESGTIDMGAYEYQDGVDPSLPVTLSSFTGNLDNGLPTLNWTTESELENMGWNIYRSEYENGLEDNSIKLTDELIPGMGTISVPTNYNYIDEQPVQILGLHFYWLESVSFGGDLEMFGPVSINLNSANLIPGTPDKSFVSQNRPNPFNPTTTVEFGIKEGESGILTIYNILGQKVLSQKFESGYHTYNWDASNHASGVYFYRLQTPSFHKANKMIMLK
ncbi:MAG: T9SS type A sorting domain-containing protein [Candidatus Cloacimonetes bacterium]|nr:T9SS type A sorting domain-containing protein [Candidatus Cloacimonadota bacterium]MCF7868777.1 T9SS type A sorting domain-containing protein [Candidatus Cloacimonadota bacterium]MCF7884207.1 T9SS type A sorting domain-containing protein [Candidatus Cloacimonadota bacterium]